MARDFTIRSKADAKSTVSAFSEAVANGDRDTAQAALRAIHAVSPKAAEAAVNAADKNRR